MDIYIIRHGQTTGDLEDRYGGEYDDALTELGQSQSFELAKKLLSKDIIKIYHSPKIRAKQTAQIISKTLESPLEEIQDIKERNSYGILSGLTRTKAEEKYPKEVAKLTTYFEHGVSGSETYEDFKYRILKALLSIIEKNHENIAIVTHGGPVSCFAREYLGLGEAKILGDCCYLRLQKVNVKLVVKELDNCKFTQEQQ
ncbi:histidine phosphatase family protein [archaeon]|jgi:broad specificity phosphatase PhoE|nr:histidine phosphatase family protein [archaeon]MBT4271885.1 histidine phosphatase family protein [archaeon]MBT4460984.1 histidine phosphatase family protein [archaeon]MBT4858441.1 histidine phosphatase family protein [archaeon]MBT5424125.1 histidine phosphatase family protein [archaeon]